MLSIEYSKSDDGTYEQGIIEVELETCIFREVSFTKINKNDLRPLNAFKINFASASSKKKVNLDTSKLVGIVTTDNGEYT